MLYPLPTPLQTTSQQPTHTRPKTSLAAVFSLPATHWPLAPFSRKEGILAKMEMLVGRGRSWGGGEGGEGCRGDECKGI
jgi:hypothetical protein